MNEIPLERHRLLERLKADRKQYTTTHGSAVIPSANFLVCLDSLIADLDTSVSVEIALEAFVACLTTSFRRPA